MAKSFEAWVFNLHLVGSYGWGNGKLNGYYRNCRDSIGIIGLYWGCIGVMENEMETTGTTGILYGDYRVVLG